MTWQPARLPQLGAIPGAFVDVNGARLHYLDTGGQGISVLLLHGINQNVRTWELVLPHLIGPWRLIAVDHRGHGLSGAPRTPYQRGDLARDYVGLISALGLRR